MVLFCASGSSGSKFPSFLSKMADFATILRASVVSLYVRTSASIARGMVSSSSIIPALNMDVNTRVAATLMRSALSIGFPSASVASSAYFSLSLENSPAVGISMSSPLFSEGTVLCVANQSDMTNPSNPKSSRKISFMYTEF